MSRRGFESQLQTGMADTLSMKVKNAVFALFVIVLTMGFSQVFRVFRDSLQEEGFEQHRRAQLEKEIEQEKLRTQIVQMQLKEFQGQVAQILPPLSRQALSQKSDYGLSKLQFSSRIPASQEQLVEDRWAFQSAKSDFLAKKYAEASEKFFQFLRRYPASPDAMEAKFLLAETYFQLNRLEQSLEVSRLMLQQYPEHPMTGYVLLRVGQIMEMRRRPQEAAEIYRSIISEFPAEKQLLKQVRKSLEDLNL